MGSVSTLPTQEDKRAFVREMFDRIAGRYGLVNTVMTFGMDRRWRRKAVASLGLPPGSAVLDLACGPGEVSGELTAFGHRPVGADISWGMLSAGGGWPAVQADAARLPFASKSFDGVVCAFGLRNFAEPESVFDEIARVLAVGGRLALLEVSEPRWPPARAVHRVYFRQVVPRIGALISDTAAYRYLPASVAYLPSPDQLASALGARGFIDLSRRSLGAGAVQLVTAKLVGVGAAGDLR